MALDSPQHTTLVADETTTVTFDEDYSQVEVLNVDGTDEIWVSFGDGGDIDYGTTGDYVLPAVIGYLTTAPRTSGPTVVRLKSPGTPRVSVRGMA